MKALNVNAVLDPVTGGGTAERTVQITRALQKENVSCTIMTTDLGLSEKVLQGLNDLDIIAYQCLVKRFYIPLISYSQIKKIVGDYDIVHIMGHWTVLNALVYKAAQALNIPYVICPAGALPIFGRSKIIKKLYNFLVGRNIVKNADAWIAITEDEKSQFASYGIEPSKISVIPNGINPEDFPRGGETVFRKKVAVNNNPFMLFLGRLNAIKGPDLLLEAFVRGHDEWNQWHLVFAGPDGGMLESLKGMVNNNDLSNRVHFAGYVGGAEKSAAYHAADCLVIPSRQEAMSIVVLEAGISSTPVVLTDQCGFNQVSDQGGGIVCSASVEGVYNSLQQITSNNDDLSNMGKALEIFVSNQYTWQVVIKKYLSLYADLLTRKCN